MDLDDINDTDRYGRTKLHIAAEKGGKAKVLSLINNGAEIDLGDDMERTALHYAVLNGHTNIVSILLEEGADTNAKDENGCSPLLLIRRNLDEIIPMLVKFGAELESKNLEGKTLLNLAAEKRDTEFVMFLLKIGFDINTKDIAGMTPTLNAAKAKNYQVVELLISQTNEDGSYMVDKSYTTSDGKSLNDFYQDKQLLSQEA